MNGRSRSCSARAARLKSKHELLRSADSACLNSQVVLSAPQLVRGPLPEVIIFCYDYAMENPANTQPGPAAVESAASIGASLAVRDRGQFAVGVHNATDFLRPATSGRAEVIAEPLQQGRVQQLWLVTITDERGKVLARGQLRL